MRQRNPVRQFCGKNNTRFGQQVNNFAVNSLVHAAGADETKSAIHGPSNSNSCAKRNGRGEKLAPSLARFCPGRLVLRTPGPGGKLCATQMGPANRRAVDLTGSVIVKLSRASVG